MAMKLNMLGGCFEKQNTHQKMLGTMASNYTKTSGAGLYKTILL